MDGKESGYQLFPQNGSDFSNSYMERERREWYIQMW